MTDTTYRNRFAQLELRILKDEERLPDSIDAMPAVMKRWGLGASPQECMWVVAYDSNLSIRTVVEISRGFHKSVDVDLASMYAAVLTSGCDRFVAIHNHPNGRTDPSLADCDLTIKINAGANACGLYFEDHLIISPRGNDTYSFVDSGFLVPAPYIMDGQNVARQ